MSDVRSKDLQRYFHGASDPSARSPQGNTSDAGSAASREPSPRPRSDLEPEEEAAEDSCGQDVLEKLKQQVANVTHARSRKVRSETGRDGSDLILVWKCGFFVVSEL